MAQAMRDGIRAGRQAYLAGRIPRKLYATASSPETGRIAAAPHS
jgi:thiazole synthase